MVRKCMSLTCRVTNQAYYITEAPYVLHYGLHFEVSGGFSFDKHRHFGFDPLLCPPWDFQPNVPHHGGLFEHPPMPRELSSTVRGLSWLQSHAFGCGDCTPRLVHHKPS